MGDFNINFLDPNQPNLNKFTELFKKFAIKQYITDITRPGRHTNSCINWIVTNSSFISESCALDIMISDHFSLHITRKKNRKSVKYVYKDIRDYSVYNPVAFTDLLRNRLSLSNFTNVNDPNALWKLVKTCAHDVLGIICPYCRYKQRENLTPWMVAEIYQEMWLRDRNFPSNTFKRITLIGSDVKEI